MLKWKYNKRKKKQMLSYCSPLRFVMVSSEECWKDRGFFFFEVFLVGKKKKNEQGTEATF